MKLLPRKDTHRLYKNTIMVAGVKTNANLCGRGYGYSLYTTLLDNGYVIMSDKVQYDGARQTYQKLSDLGKYIVDLFDDKEKEFIAKDIKLEHGQESWEIDDKVWSFNNSKLNLKIVVRKK